MNETKLLFVCLGNICRSPMAEGMVQRVAARHDVSKYIETDSAGTGNWHEGSRPDERAIRASAERGSDISGQSARQIVEHDFFYFDHIFAMDDNNLKAIRNLAPAAATSKISLFMSFTASPHMQVPDPYYGDEAGFEHALSLIEEGAETIIAHFLKDQAASS